jgi:hypothetical protein
MNPEIQKQINDYLSKAQSVAIALPDQVTVDQYMAAVALAEALGNQGKDTTIMTSAAQLPQLAFLDPLPKSLNQIQPGGSLSIQVATKDTTLDELSYQTTPEAVTIFLKPRSGAFSATDVSVQAQTGSYEVIVLLGVQSMEQLGSLYQKSAEFFFNIPKINIDINPANEYSGTINVVEVTASSLSEIVSSLLSDEVKTERVATLLLTGIIAATHSFRDPRTTPETLTTAAKLMGRGAHQTEIIQHLFKTKAFATLKLWGRALARLVTVPESSLIYSVVTRTDLEKTGQTLADLPAVLRDIIENITGYNIVALFAESNGGMNLLLAGLPHIKVADLARQFAPTAAVPITLHGLYEYITVDIPDMTVPDAEKKLLSIIGD